MITEINLIEQKKKNIVTYFIIVVFTLMASAAGLVLYWQLTELQTRVDTLQSHIEQNLNEISEQSTLKNIQQQRETLAEQVATIESMVFPAVELLDEMDALLPGNSYFASYAFTSSQGLSLVIQMESMKQIATYSNVLNHQSYINLVTISNISSQGEGYSVSLQIDIDRQAWIEVTADDS